MSAERVIHASIFFLLVVGLGVLGAWASYIFLQSNLILVIAGIALIWGVILSVVYLLFKKLGWKWWS
jgi:hypothetical protein